MGQQELKNKLFYRWMVLILAALYARDAYEKIYYLKYNVNFPHRWTVFWIIIAVFIITLVVIAISNRKNKDKNQTSFGRSFMIAFLATTFNNIIQNKTDSIMRHAVDIDKAARDIIRWYVFGFVASVVICTILEYFEARKKKKTEICETGDSSHCSE